MVWDPKTYRFSRYKCKYATYTNKHVGILKNIYMQLSESITIYNYKIHEHKKYKSLHIIVWLSLVYSYDSINYFSYLKYDTSEI